MIDKHINKTTMINELKNYIGELITYKNYQLRVSEVSHRGVTLMRPEDGAVANIPVEKFAEIVRMREIALQK